LKDALVIEADIIVYSSDNPRTIYTRVEYASHSDRMQTLLTESLFADICLKFANSTETIRCHRYFLASWSPVFKTMFNSETSETNCNEILLEDVDPRVMMELLVRIYTGCYSVGPVFTESAVELLWVAARYSIALVVEECEEQLASQLNVGNVLSILKAADMTGSRKLKNHCLEYMAANCVNIFSSTNIMRLLAEE
jgi:hypothetical protein